MKDICDRCGKCCIVNNGRYWVDCRYLCIDQNGFCTCTIYHKRLGTHIGNLYVCINRLEMEWDYPGCPYNTGKPLHPAYEEVKK